MVGLFEEQKSPEAWCPSFMAVSHGTVSIHDYVMVASQETPPPKHRDHMHTAGWIGSILLCLRGVWQCWWRVKEGTLQTTSRDLRVSSGDQES